MSNFKISKLSPSFGRTFNLTPLHPQGIEPILTDNFRTVIQTFYSLCITTYIKHLMYSGNYFHQLLALGLAMDRAPNPVFG